MTLSEVTEVWDGILYNVYNVFSDFLFFLKSIRLRRIILKNKLLNNIHSGERCFIVMNGPSLNSHDLSFLRDEIVFCANFIYRSDIVNTINPNYYCWSDGGVFLLPDAVQIFNDIMQKCPRSKLLLNIKGREVLGESERIYYEYRKHIPNLFSIHNNMRKNVSYYSTVALQAINSALYMGFNEIYILGLDFEPGVFKHFVDLGVRNGDPSKMCDKDEVCGRHWQYTKAQYESYAINKFALKRGVRIINLNRGSNIRAFEFGDYEDLFA